MSIYLVFWTDIFSFFLLSVGVRTGQETFTVRLDCTGLNSGAMCVFRTHPSVRLDLTHHDRYEDLQPPPMAKWGVDHGYSSDWAMHVVLCFFLFVTTRD